MKFVLEDLFICLALVLWIYWLWMRREFYKFSFKVPCLWGLPYLGISLDVGSISNFLRYLTKQVKVTKNRSFCLWLAATPFLFTVDPKVVKQVLLSWDLLEKSDAIYTSVNEGLTGGIVATPVKKWHLHRKVMSPLLRPKQVLHFMPMFNKKCKEFLKLVEEGCTAGRPRDVLNDLRIFSILQTLETAFEYTDEKSIERMDKYVKDLIFVFKQGGIQAFLSSLKIRFLVKYRPKLLTAQKALYDFGNRVVTGTADKLQIATSESTPLDANDDDMSKYKQYHFVENALIHYNSGGLIWSEIVGDVNALIIGAFETSSTSTYILLSLLAMHPEIQEKLFEEIKDAFPDKDFEVHPEDFENLKYLEMVISEIIRLFPPVPLIGRQVITNNINLEIDGQTVHVPKDIQILISLYTLHRDEKVWGPNPEDFNPDHFLPHKIAERDAYEYIPFSKGPRNCVGWNYAMYSLRVMVSHILRNYKVMTDFKYKDFSVNLSMFLEIPKKPVLIFERRD